jgi:hypothetical protein
MAGKPVRQPYAGVDFIPQLEIYEFGYGEDPIPDPSVLSLLPGHPVINPIYPLSCRYRYLPRNRFSPPAGSIFAQDMVRPQKLCPGFRKITKIRKFSCTRFDETVSLPKNIDKK